MWSGRIVLMLLLITLLSASCSVMSQQVTSESIPPVSFQTLQEDTEKYEGDTLILGGYILETKNLPGETIIKVLQTPLGYRDEPKSKDFSEGRFIVSHEGFLDPKVYEKGRKITVAAKLVGTTEEKAENFFYRYLKLQSREIYLWPKYEKDYHYPYYDPWYYPFPYPYYWFYRHPLYRW